MWSLFVVGMVGMFFTLARARQRADLNASISLETSVVGQLRRRGSEFLEAANALVRRSLQPAHVVCTYLCRATTVTMCDTCIRWVAETAPCFAGQGSSRPCHCDVVLVEFLWTMVCTVGCVGSWEQTWSCMVSAVLSEAWKRSWIRGTDRVVEALVHLLDQASDHESWGCLLSITLIPRPELYALFAEVSPCSLQTAAKGHGQAATARVV